EGLLPLLLAGYAQAATRALPADVLAGTVDAEALAKAAMALKLGSATAQSRMAQW
ncbi:unnamed protein product, partial [Durusdinium trenchii]